MPEIKEKLYRFIELSNKPDIASVIFAGGVLLASCSIAVENDPGVYADRLVDSPTTDISMPTEQITTNLMPSTSRITVAETTTTVSNLPDTQILSDTTTTTIDPWGEREYQPNNCDQGNVLRVHIQSQTGLAISAQVSVDYMIGDQKVDPNGNPIPSGVSYSDHYKINRDAPPQGYSEGLRDVCFENIPDGASVYVEAYSLAKTGDTNPNTAYVATEEYYGHSMSHQIWPGPGQVVYLNQPAACSIGGDSGSITAHVYNDGQDLNPFRIAAWSNGRNGRTGFSYGFGVEDVYYNGTTTEDTLATLASGEEYVLQVQSYDENGTQYLNIIKDVPVDSCSQTDVEIDNSQDKCVANIGGIALDCTLNDKLIG